MAKKQWHLEEWRKHRDMSQERLADLVNDHTESWGDRAMRLSKSDVSKLERGKRRFNSDQLAAFAAVLECEQGDLVDYTPEQANEIKRLVGAIVKRGRTADMRLLRAIAEEDESGSNVA